MYKRSRLLRVALETRRIIRGGGAQLPRLESTVRMMAIGALHHPFVNAMMKGAVELLLRLQMAAVTELGLFLLHQALAFLCLLYTSDAADE